MNKFEQLIPSYRIKRGLLNPLGSLIKIVTGNLDHDDAVRYDKLISELNGKQIHVDKKITVISTMLDTLVNSTETLHNNSLILEDRLKRIETIVKTIATKENNSMYSTYILSMFYLFNNNFRSIYLTLSEIETALALSKVSVLHQSLVNHTELMLMLESISRTHSLMYPVTLSNMIKIERSMEVKAYVKSNQITYIMEIPLVDNSTYTYYKLYPLPTMSDNRTTLIIPKYPYLLAKGPKFIPLAKPCREVSTNEYLCTIDDMVLYPEQTCAEQLIKFQKDLSLCIPRVVGIEDIRIQRIGPLSWILFCKTDVVLTRKCSEDINREPLRGTYILTIDESCTFYIGDTKLSNFRYYAKELYYRVTPIITLPEPKLINVSIANTMNLQGVNLDDLKHLSYLLKNGKDLSDSELPSEKGIKVQSVSLATIILYIFVIFVILCVTLVYFKDKILPFCKNGRNHQDSSDSPGNFALEEGGVMHPNHPQIIRVRA